MMRSSPWFAITTFVGLCLLVLAGCTRPTSLVVATDEEAELVRQIAGHRHWTRKVAEEEVEGWVKEIEGLKGDGLFEIDQSGTVYTATGADAAKTRLVYQHVSPYKMVVLSLTRWSKQPSRLEILEELKREVDKADFRPAEPPPPATDD